MTGEMSRSEVTPENFPLHFAIAEALGGTVHPFDQYQGPYVADLPMGGKLWLCMDDSGFGYVYNDKNDRQSAGFYIGYTDAHKREIVSAAREVV